MAEHFTSERVMSKRVMSSRWLLMLGAGALLAVAIGAVYGQALHAPFVYDDLSAIKHNPYTRALWPIGRAMAAPQDSPLAGRPIVSFTFAVNFAVSAMQPWSYHALNMVFHFGCAVLLALLVRGTLQRTRLSDWAGPLALGAALLWAVHPLNTDAVQYVTQRTELMVALCYLGTLVCFMRGASETAYRAAWLTGAVAVCALGMLCKEVMVSAPLMVLLYDRQFFAGTFGQALRRRGLLYAGLAATWLILVGVLLAEPRTKSVGFHHDVGAWEYLLTQSRVLVWYLRLVVWPDPLVIHHEWPLVEHWTDALLTGPVILALLALTVYGLVRARPWHLLGAWCFMILAPSSSFVPIVTEVAAERRMYLPLAALVAAAVCAAAWGLRYARVAPARRVGAMAGVALVLALGATLALASVERLRDFRTSWSAWDAVLAVYPDSAIAHNNAASMLVNAGRLEEAERHLRRALEIDPEYKQPRINLGNIYSRRDEYEKAEKHYQMVLDESPNAPAALKNLGLLRVLQERYEAAIPILRKALERDPNSVSALNSLGKAYFELGRTREAVSAFQAALRVRPEARRPRKNLANVLVQLGRTEQANQQFELALRRFPYNAALHNAYGAFLVRQGRPSAAVAHFQAALRNGVADQRKVRKRLAVTLHRAGQYRAAAGQFTALLKQTPSDADAHRRFASLLMDMGRRNEALRHAKRAVELAPENEAARALLQRVRSGDNELPSTGR